MIKPLDNLDRQRTVEYVNRVKQIDPGHHPITRDFAYEIGEVEAERKKHRQASPEFGEDSYEPTAQEREERSKTDSTSHHDSTEETGSETLDITI